MSDDRVSVGIIGTGLIGTYHLEQYATINGVDVVAVANRTESVARDIAERFGIANIYSDFRELLARDDIQAVDVCLHNNLHMPVTVAALLAGKDVFCEKPMAGSYADALTMYDAARRTGRRLHVQCDSLFAPSVKAARQLVDAGYLGRLYHARAHGHRRRGRPFIDGYGSPPFVQKRFAAGGALYDMGVYRISTLLYLLGNPEVETVSGATHQELTLDESRREAGSYDVEELGLGFVRLAGGVTVDIIEAWAAHLDRLDGSILLGTDAGLRLEPFGVYQSVGDLDLDASVNLNEFVTRLADVRDGDKGMESAQHHWIAALQGRVDLIPMDEIGLNTMLIAEGIYISDRLGREVTANEVKELSVSTSLDP